MNGNVKGRGGLSGFRIMRTRFVRRACEEVIGISPELTS